MHVDVPAGEEVSLMVFIFGVLALLITGLQRTSENIRWVSYEVGIRGIVI